MTLLEIKQVLIQVLIKELYVKDFLIEEQSTMEDMGLDSLDVISLCMKVENNFQIPNFENYIYRYSTFSETVDLIHKIKK